jgi:hypothetical protein
MRMLALRTKATTVLSCGVLGIALRLVTQPGPADRGGSHFDHVVIVVMENQGASQALSDANIASIVKQAAWFSNYHAVSHPSLPNSLALVAGSTYGVTRDYVDTSIKRLSIISRLEQKGLTWKAYAEDYQGRCLKSDAGKSVTPNAKAAASSTMRRVPFLSFAAVQNSPVRCGRVVNASQFMTDARAGKLPNYSFYSPNIVGVGSHTPAERSAVWLKQFVGSLQGTGAMDQRTLLMIVWDEGRGDDMRSNRALAMLLGPMITQGRYSARLTHYSLLRTIEDNFGLLPVADGDATASPVPEEVWRASAP